MDNLSVQDMKSWEETHEVEYASKFVTRGSFRKRVVLYVSMSKNYRVELGGKVVYEGVSADEAVDEFNNIK